MAQEWSRCVSLAAVGNITIAGYLNSGVSQGTQCLGPAYVVLSLIVLHSYEILPYEFCQFMLLLELQGSLIFATTFLDMKVLVWVFSF